jgi:hypothetical protein
MTNKCSLCRLQILHQRYSIVAFGVPNLGPTLVGPLTDLDVQSQLLQDQNL